MSKKTLEELVFHDDFMFAAVMMDAENCRCFLERVLEIQIERVEISTEHGFFFNPECKSIRMDVFAKDENRTHYDIEMQLVKKDSLEKRSRYYHSQMDVEMLEKGKSYGELADTYVIFICNFDPLGQKKCRYTIRRYCEETGNVFGDGVCTVFLNTNGKNREEIPKELVALLDFVKADLAGSEADYEDALVKRLQESMRQIKRSRKMGERYMMFEQYMKEYVQEHADEIREEAREEGLAEVENPSEYMLDGRPKEASGAVVSCSFEGTRPILLEVQALVAETSFGMPRRTAAGTDYNRVNLLMAVLEKRCRYELSRLDAYVNITGGMRMSEPALDLAIVMALMSSYKDRPVDPGMLIFGEVGLSGEVRGVSQAAQRVAEAAKLGFTTCVLPKVNMDKIKPVEGIRMIGVSNVREAIGLL